MQKEDRFLKGSSCPQMSIFLPKNQVKTKKKGHQVRRPLIALKPSKIFRGRMIWHVFTFHIMPKRRTFGHFLAFSEDKRFLGKKEDMFSKRRTYGI